MHEEQVYYFLYKMSHDHNLRALILATQLLIYSANISLIIFFLTCSKKSVLAVIGQISARELSVFFFFFFLSSRVLI